MDFLSGQPAYSGGGIALILGGGPHIPRDSMPASAIRDVPLERHRDAITVWPNPANTVVHIAWRGDLSRTPARFTVHDALGQLVALGAVPGRDGDALWSCPDRPTGIYLLSIFDREGRQLVVIPIVKL